MVSFLCEVCDRTLKKKQVEKHFRFECRGAYGFICIDCKKCFSREEQASHNQCISEQEQTYGQYYKPKDKKVKGENGEAKTVETKPQPAAKEETKQNGKTHQAEETEEQEWKGWKRTLQSILMKQTDRTMKVKNLRKKMMSVAKANGIEIAEKEFDETFDLYLKNYSRFRLVDGNEVKFLRKYELQLEKAGKA
eukprot:CAMPEP_0176448000 /NCGR_PEP_ID=MMETSP0127-20121128/25461_1 /TAXON_ID=938130 /ORGANISM="Platyophrya macrostoma, Strain WH" /LENGTH=192 /DNA_ID=CAMNT_0017834743 /DNA_START=14 /DNA_END=592 /DNA_ORIENTATION=-